MRTSVRVLKNGDLKSLLDSHPNKVSEQEAESAHRLCACSRLYCSCTAFKNKTRKKNHDYWPSSRLGFGQLLAQDREETQTRENHEYLVRKKKKSCATSHRLQPRLATLTPGHITILPTDTIICQTLFHT